MGTIKPDQVKAYFEQFGRIREVEMKYSASGEFRRFGFITFDTLEAAQAVLDNGTKNRIDGKWIDCRCAGDAVNPAGAKPSAPKPQARIESMLRLRGMPFNSTPEDIINFFGDFKPQAATTCADAHGRASGEALVEFSDGTSCSAAFALKQGGHIGSNHIELVHATQDDIVRMRPLKTATA